MFAKLVKSTDITPFILGYEYFKGLPCVNKLKENKEEREKEGRKSTCFVATGSFVWTHPNLLHTLCMCTSTEMPEFLHN